MRAALLLLVLSPACAIDLLGEYESGGAANLPRAGGGPFRKLAVDLATPADEPYVASDGAAQLSDPSAVAGDDGIALWLGRAEVSRAGSSIVRLAITDLAAAPGELALSLAPDAAWEAGRVARPAVIDLGGGALRMYYEGGDPAAPAIGRADSTDGGASWTKDPGNPILTGGGDPAAVRVDGRDLVYFTRPDADGIHLAEGDDLAPIGQVLAPRDDLDGAFDGERIGEPGALAVPRLGGGTRIALYYTGTRVVSGEPLSAIGWAGSFDGSRFERGGDDPILSPGPPGEGGGTVVFDGGVAVLFFHELRRARLAIAAAIETP